MRFHVCQIKRHVTLNLAKLLLHYICLTGFGKSHVVSDVDLLLPICVLLHLCILLHRRQKDVIIIKKCVSDLNISAGSFNQ